MKQVVMSIGYFDGDIVGRTHGSFEIMVDGVLRKNIELPFMTVKDREDTHRVVDQLFDYMDKEMSKESNDGNA